jgi:hypothetical protein
VNDYDDNARFYSEAEIYQEKQEIQRFFVDFIASLPAGGIDRFRSGVSGSTETSPKSPGASAVTFLWAPILSL